MCDVCARFICCEDPSARSVCTAVNVTVCAPCMQVRMISGKQFLSPGGPFKDLGQLWDEPEEVDRMEVAMSKVYDLTVVTPTAKLNTKGGGMEMPMIGLGTWKMKEAGEAYKAVTAAVKVRPCGWSAPWMRP